MVVVGLALAFCPSSPANVQAAPAPASVEDPSTEGIALPTWRSRYVWSEDYGYAGWATQTSSTDSAAYEFAPGLDTIGGLWSWPTGDREYRPGGGEWVLRAPGTTRIARASLDVAYRTKIFAHHCIESGLRTSAGPRAGNRDCKPPEKPASEDGYVRTLEDPESSPAATEAYLQIVMPPCNNPADTPCSKYIPPKDPAGNGPMARMKAVSLVLVDDDLPVLTGGGPFFALDGKYINGREVYRLDVSATDAGAGITRLGAAHEGHALLGESAAPCDPYHRTPELGARVCPEAHATAIDVDTRPMPEGTQRFRLFGTDPAGNEGERRFTVIIDRTPPAVPVGAFTSPEEGSAQATWAPSVDPVLADGTPGSGLAGYRVRHRVAEGEWSSWTTTGPDGRTSAELYDHPAGTPVEFEVAAFDAVDNVSEPVVIAGAVPGDLPELSVTGALRELDGRYVARQLLGVALSATDAGAGMRRLSLSRDGAGEILAGDAPCTPRTTPEGAPWKALCPAEHSIWGAVDSAALPEGANTFEAVAVDRAGNVERDRWSVLVDHTPPAGPQDVRFQDYSPERREAELTWEEDDPDLPGEVPGSGIARTEYRVLRGDTWSAWIETEEGAVTLENADPGERITAQVHAIDVVGNKSLPTEIVVEVPSGPRDEGEVEVEEQPRMMRTMQKIVPVAVCVPRIKKGRARHVAPDHQSFRPATTRLGARMAVWCRNTDARNIDSIEVTASWFVWNDSDDEWDRIGTYGDDDESFLKVRLKPRDYYDVNFDGVDTPCLPRLGGRRKYAVGGHITFFRDGNAQGPPKTYKSSDKHLRCPDKAERFRRALAGWDELVRLRSPHSDGTNRPGHVQLAKSLDLPSLPDWKVDRAWAAHHIVPATKSKVHDLQVMMFRCRIHPNSTTNGVYLRDFGLKKTRSGRINPDWKLLEQRSRALAHRTYHGDTFSERYDDIVRDMTARGMRAALTGDETCSGDDVRNLRSDLADIEERLKNGNLGMQNPDN